MTNNQLTGVLFLFYVFNGIKDLFFQTNMHNYIQYNTVYLVISSIKCFDVL